MAAGGAATTERDKAMDVEKNCGIYLPFGKLPIMLPVGVFKAKIAPVYIFTESVAFVAPNVTGVHPDATCCDISPQDRNTA